MYERMLDKQIEPSFEDMITYSGEAGKLWLKLDLYLRNELEFMGSIRFPYGNNYGWGMNYTFKNKHICDAFAEKDAFMILMSVSEKIMLPMYEGLGTYAKSTWDNRYPCASGGWLNYRIIKEEQLEDFITIINGRIPKKNSKQGK